MNTVLFQFAKSILNRLGLHVAKFPYSHQHAFIDDINAHLIKKSTGVLHLGAHVGQEREDYNFLNVQVLWVEGNPEIFPILQENIRQFPNQKALLAILGNSDGTKVAFKVSDNGAVSSSVFSLDEQNSNERFRLNREMILEFSRLDSLFQRNNIDARNYSHWVVDLQGAELIALQGAGHLLHSCLSMYVEVSTRPIYEGGANWIELKDFLSTFNLFPLWTPRDNHHENVIFIRG